ncbi:class I SAM-dependent methyltransferase [Thalassococcus lentus]|uniref:Class I SAM-dependent methyltransferase n=1 Tax=Thalassococcus lentus TaxID=1210524 RepID=A0ABT4XWX5_9RHOB|nr:class I SAM-dependent methyltransferase [Thalassococcus lentus]MDA7426471.1 class I SAM-dependent methyltransferase [Thalassococcus lentus]
MPRSEWIKLPPSERIPIIGHRAFVGGQAPEIWYGIGRRQFHFLVSQGLCPDHRFLDIACGSLRLGQYLIPYLQTGHYQGLEAEPALVEAGLREELLFDLNETKKPTFGYGYDFDFSFVTGFDYAIAQSLFTHLTAEDIHLCLKNLRPVAQETSRLFVTFSEGDAINEDSTSDAHKKWQYTFPALEQITNDAGWSAHYIGDWGHERGQKMVRLQIR